MANQLEEGQIVLCTVEKILGITVFCKIEGDGEGTIITSEISPGRIRNLRDYVSVWRQIVCKVLRVDSRTGHIDLSLRRVNSTQRREKLEDIKQELKAENLVSNLAKKLNASLQKLYQDITKKIFPEYSQDRKSVV